MTLSVDEFKARLAGGGARANLFRVELAFPAGVAGRNESEAAGFLVKAAQIPGSTIAPIMVPFRGRMVPFGGDRTFEPWTITVLNDTDYAIRNAFERWMNYINSHVENSGEINPTNYSADASVFQLDRQGRDVKEYRFRSIWPSNLAPIDVSYDNADQIEEYTVELQVTYWTSDTTT